MIELEGLRDERTTLELTVAALILDQRLSEEARDRRGLTYGCRIWLETQRSAAFANAFAFGGPCDGAAAPPLLELATSAFERLVREPPSEEEVRRATSWIETQIAVEHEPEAWLHNLSAVRRGRPVESPEVARSTCREIGPSDVHRAMAKHARPETWMRIAVFPTEGSR